MKSFSAPNLLAKIIVSGLIVLSMGTSCRPKAVNVKTGIFEGSTDIGGPTIKGNAFYEASSQTYLLEGGGENIWGENDQLH